MFINVIIKSINRTIICSALIILVGSLTSQIQAHTCSFYDSSPLRVILSDSQTFHNNTKHFWRTLPMQNKDRDFHFSVPDPQSKLQRFKTFKIDPELLQIEQNLRELNVWEDQSIQNKFRLAKFGTPKSSKRAKVELLEFIEELKELAMRLEDSYFPYASADQISNGGRGIHILDQVHNNIPYMADQDKFLLGCLTLGRQAGGKTSAAFNIVRQVTVPILILDPKNSWKFRGSAIGATLIPEPYISFDLRAPPNTNEADYLASEMEGLALATGLQYGLDCLNEACDIALEQRRRYREQSEEDTPLCLRDIYECLPLCSFKKSRRIDYITSARTALSLVLGKGHLFATRSGLPLDELFQGRYILPCHVMNTHQCRYLGFHLFNYQHYASRGKPETTHLKNLILVDDSSKFISKPDSIFGSGSRASPWLHILSVLRSSGTGMLFLDQTVQTIWSDVKQLCHIWLVVGGIQGRGNQDEVASAMALDQAQKEMLGRLQTRECIFFCPTSYVYPVHGFVPIVPEPEESNNQ